MAGAAFDEVIARAEVAFARDADVPPPLTLRGGSAVDGYDAPAPYDAAADAPTDAYVERHAYFAMPFLDAHSWRHYLPRLMRYAADHPDDPAMAVEALVRSLRPPDRAPPRLATLTPAQEAVVTAFLEILAVGDDPRAGASPLRDDAVQALEEWWLPNPRHRPPPGALDAARSAPVRYRRVRTSGCSLELPESFVGWGERDVPEESRRVAGWRGHLRGDAAAHVVINTSPLSARSLDAAVRQTAARLDAVLGPARAVAIPGARRARRLDGITHPASPAEPERVTTLFAETARAVHTLTLRAWPRDDVADAVERVVASFRVEPAGR